MSTFMKKNHSIVIRLSKEQLDKIKAKAEKVGMSISDFIRFLALKTNIREVTVDYV